MSARLLTLLASAATMTMAGAFTIDFNNLMVSDGTTPSSFSFDPVDGTTSQTVTVPGYGDVRFEVGPTSGDELQVGFAFSNDSGTITQSLELGATETVVVTFLGPTALNVDFDIIGIDAGENSSVAALLPNEFQYGPPNGDGAGIAAISFEAVPEPSSSLLVILGAGSMLLRRRR